MTEADITPLGTMENVIGESPQLEAKLQVIADKIDLIIATAE